MPARGLWRVAGDGAVLIRPDNFVAWPAGRRRNIHTSATLLGGSNIGGCAF
jgi:hypothetical protein